MKKREFIIPLLLVLVTHFINATTYENAEDGTTNGWSAYSTNSNIATITNVYDSEKASKVISVDDIGLMVTDDSNGTEEDTLPPIITLNGDANVTIEKDGTYTELNATAVDDVDGNISVSISGTVDTATVGVYTLTYTAIDSSDNSASKTRAVNIQNNTNKPQITKLMLSAEKINLISKYESFYKTYVPARSPIKVIATYDDGKTEEVTDQVKWGGGSKDIAFGSDFFQAYIGVFKLSASLRGVTSNEITIEVKDEENSEVKNILITKLDTKGRDTTIYTGLPQKPTADIKLTVRIKREDKVRLFNQGDSLEQTFVITPEACDPNSIHTLHIMIEDMDVNSTKDYTLITEPLISDDPYYDGKNPEDILVKYVTKNPRLTAPRLIERKGAIRGVSIKFRVTAKEKHLKYTLVNPPSGMKIIEDPMFHLPTGVTVQWDVPMDSQEGVTHTITMRAEDGEYHSDISFPIKIPKTRELATKIENGELTVIEQNSPLFGMKFKGHEGEDISNLELRSVDVGDVWKHSPSRFERGKELKYIVFTIDNKIPKLNIDISDNKYLDFYRYSEEVYFGDNLWTDISHGYIVNNDGTHTLVRNEYDNGGTKVYFIVIEKKGV